VDRVDASRVKEDALGQGRLARVDMRTDSDISDLLDITEHRFVPLVSTGLDA
jgi:hypothetical protein